MLTKNTMPCPQHNSERVIPAGVSRKNGQPYQAFIICGVQGCAWKPERPSGNGGRIFTPKNPVIDIVVAMIGRGDKIATPEEHQKALLEAQKWATIIATAGNGQNTLSVSTPPAPVSSPLYKSDPPLPPPDFY